MDINALTKMSQTLGLKPSSLESILSPGSANDPTTTDPMTDILKNQQQLVTLSAVSKSASKAFQVAQNTGDDKVATGLQQTISALVAQPLSADSFAVMQTISTLATDEPAALNGVLGTVNSLTERGLTGSVTSYLSAVTQAYAKAGSAAVTTLNEGVAKALADSNANSAQTIEALTKVLQQYQPAAVVQAAGTTPQKTVILADSLTYVARK